MNDKIERLKNVREQLKHFQGNGFDMVLIDTGRSIDLELTLQIKILHSMHLKGIIKIIEKQGLLFYVNGSTIKIF